MHQQIARGRRLMNQHSRPAAAAPHRPIAFAPAAVNRTIDADGIIRLTCPVELGAYDPNLARLFRAAVDAQPERVFLAERAGDAWRRLTYAQTRPQGDALAAALLMRGLSAAQPVMILSANAIDHALLMLAGYTAGI